MYISPFSITTMLYVVAAIGVATLVLAIFQLLRGEPESPGVPAFISLMCWIIIIVYA